MPGPGNSSPCTPEASNSGASQAPSWRPVPHVCAVIRALPARTCPSQSALTASRLGAAAGSDPASIFISDTLEWSPALGEKAADHPERVPAALASLPFLTAPSAHSHPQPPAPSLPVAILALSVQTVSLLQNSPETPCLVGGGQSINLSEDIYFVL